MSSEKKTSNGISRRDFFKGSALTVAGIAAGGLLAGCGKEKQAPAQAPAGKPAKYSWETPPAPIPASQIKETVEADVVVVGSGLAGNKYIVKVNGNMSCRQNNFNRHRRCYADARHTIRLLDI